MGLPENAQGGFAEIDHLGQLKMTSESDPRPNHPENDPATPDFKPHVEFPITRSQVGEVAINAYDTEPGELPFVSPSTYEQ